MKKCFVISPIGQEGSDVRKHADAVFEFIIEPAVKDCGKEAFRSDHLDKPGWITDQVFEEIYTADVCIADLTFGNPNVFYELGVAQTAARPVITLIKKGNLIPFDMRDFRCIEYDLDMPSFKSRTYIDRVIRYIREYEADNWQVKDLLEPFRKCADSHEPFQLEPLPDRSALYRKAVELIPRAHYISDTTWGRAPRRPSIPEQKARAAYRAASEEAIRNGIMYKDLFSVNMKCDSEVRKLMDDYAEYPNYEARCIEGIGASLPVIDFLLTDKNEILLSHVTFGGGVPMPMYVYIQSETLAEFYAGLFNDCWVYSKPSAVFP